MNANVSDLCGNDCTVAWLSEVHVANWVTFLLPCRLVSRVPGCWRDLVYVPLLEGAWGMDLFRSIELQSEGLCILRMVIKSTDLSCSRRSVAGAESCGMKLAEGNGVVHKHLQSIFSVKADIFVSGWQYRRLMTNMT
ncbi:hypothetical protein MHYP_G00324530 [Metynnis hypsauchen]